MFRPPQRNHLGPVRPMSGGVERPLTREIGNNGGLKKEENAGCRYGD